MNVCRIMYAGYEVGDVLSNNSGFSHFSILVICSLYSWAIQKNPPIPDDIHGKPGAVPHPCEFRAHLRTPPCFPQISGPRSAGANFLLAAWCGVQELRKKRRSKRHLLALLTCFSILALILRRGKPDWG